MFKELMVCLILIIFISLISSCSSVKFDVTDLKSPAIIGNTLTNGKSIYDNSEFVNDLYGKIYYRESKHTESDGLNNYRITETYKKENAILDFKNAIEESDKAYIGKLKFNVSSMMFLGFVSHSAEISYSGTVLKIK